jgi:hypothetical protein
MKTKVSFLSKIITLAVVLSMTTAVAFADSDITDLYAAGTTNTLAGDFVVRTTNDVFHFQGNEYEVYTVYYDDPSMNMKIAVNVEGKCKSFIAYNSEFTMFYNCNKDGFGVRKVMFSNPDAHLQFDPLAFQNQTVLLKQRKIEKKDAVELIAAFLPGMQNA